MSAVTSIEWTDRTWNPVRGCSRVSEGCRNCYAEKMAARFSGLGIKRGRGFDTFKGFATLDPPHWTGRVELVASALSAPLSWRKPARIFVNSMSDLFHEALSSDLIDQVFATMAYAGALSLGHTFQILTKRAERAANYLSFVDRQEAIIFAARDLYGEEAECHVGNSLAGILGEGHNVGWPMRNVWLGVSVEDQKTADERIPLLLQTPAAVRFVSYEPALGPVDFRNLRGGTFDAVTGRDFERLDHDDTPPLDWVIVGGESGPGARPFDIEWARSTLEQCKAAGVACFVKQLGYKAVETTPSTRRPLMLKNSKGGDPNEWPADIRVREFPTPRTA